MVKHSNTLPLKAKSEFPLKHPQFKCLSEVREFLEEIMADHFGDLLKVTGSYSGELKFQGEYQPLLFAHGRSVMLRLYISDHMVAYKYPFCTIADIEGRPDSDDVLEFLYDKAEAVLNENRDEIEEAISKAYDAHLEEIEDEREHRYYVRTHAL